MIHEPGAILLINPFQESRARIRCLCLFYIHRGFCSHTGISFGTRKLSKVPVARKDILIPAEGNLVGKDDRIQGSSCRRMREKTRDLLFCQGKGIASEQKIDVILNLSLEFRREPGDLLFNPCHGYLMPRSA